MKVAVIQQGQRLCVVIVDTLVFLLFRHSVREDNLFSHVRVF